MTNGPLSGIQVCVFDAYGTLLDFNSAVDGERSRLGDRVDALSALWRTKQLEYTWLRSLMGHHVDFWQVTGEALDYALERLDLTGSDLRGTLMAAYRRLAPYPEVPDMLRRLKARGMRCAILSNGAPDMLKAGVESAGLSELLDAVLSVEAVGIFKPDRRVYQMVLDHYGCDAGNVAFQSSNAWDVHGGAAFGFQSVWVNRMGAPRERLPGTPCRELVDLSGLPDLVAAA